MKKTMDICGETYTVVLELQKKEHIIYKDGTWYLFKEDTLRPISVNEAKYWESNVLYADALYQADQDFQRGGTPREIAYANHGFDSNGYLLSSAIDTFLTKETKQTSR